MTDWWDEDEEHESRHVDCPDYPGHHEDEVDEYGDRNCPYEGTHTDWSRVYPHLGDTIHRGMGLNLGEHHDAVHDESQSLHERGHALLQHLHGLGGLGSHWTPEEHMGRHYAHTYSVDDGYHGAGKTPVVVHAHKPEMEHIETDPDELKAGDVIGFDQHDDAEVPLSFGAPVKVKGVSWAHPSQPNKWHRYDLPEGKSVHHEAYARRECDGCGRGMQPYHPRKTVGEQLLCPMCAQNEGRRMASTPKMVRVAVRHAQGALDLATARPAQGVAYYLSCDKPNLVVLAHDSGDSMTIFHCPFCGSGQVIARSDGSVECEFCHAAFTVQVQPEFSAFPQTIGGVPVDVPGMGPDQQAPQDGQEPLLPGEEEGEDVPPFAEDDGASDEEEEGSDEEDAPPFAKKSYRTEAGHELNFEQYLQHIAIECARDRKTVLAAVRTANGRR